MATAELKINVGDLDAGGKEFSFPLRAAWLRGLLEDHEATASGPDGVLAVRASRSGNDVVVHGTMKASLEVPCARCLKPVPLEVEQTLSLLFVPGKMTPPPIDPKAAKAAEAKEAREAKAAGKKKKRAELEEYEISAEDADTLPFDGEIIPLDDIVRDELILETPIFPLCSEDCPGMSPPPGVSYRPDGAGDATSSQRADKSGVSKTDDVAASEADIDPRLRPLLRLKTKQD